MTLATPSRAPTPLQDVRPSGLALLSAGAVAGFGLGLAGLALTAQVPVVTPLPPIEAVAAAPADIAVARGAPAEWPPLFGIPAAAPVLAPMPEPEPEAEPEYDPMDDFDADAYILRGLAVGEDGTDGYALLETADGVIVVRRGDVLADGYDVLDITPEGIEIDLFGTIFVIGFSEESQPLDTDFQDGRHYRVDEGPVRDTELRGGENSSRDAPDFPDRPGRRSSGAGDDFPGDGPLMDESADAPVRPRFAISR